MDIVCERQHVEMCDEMKDVGIFGIRWGIELYAVETRIEDRRGNREYEIFDMEWRGEVLEVR